MTGPADRTRPGPRARLEAWADQSLFNRLSLATLVLSLTVLVPAVILSFVLSWRLVRQDLARRQEALAELDASRVTSALQAARAAVADLAQSPLLATALTDSEGWQAYGVPFLRGHRLPLPVEARVALCDYRGRILGASAEPPTVTPLDWVPQVEGGAWHAAIHGDGARGHLLLVAPVRFLASGTVEGSVAAEIPLHPLAEALLAGGAPARIVGADGRGLTGEPGFWRRQVTTSEPVRLDPPFDALGLRVEVAAPPGATARAFAWLAALHLAVALAVLALGLAMARRVSRQLSRPLADLAEAAWIGSGNPEAGLRIPVQGHGELARLTVAFNELLEQLDRSRQAAEAGLRHEKDEAELALRLAHGALERSTEAISISEPTGRIAYVNEAACLLLARPREEVLGRQTWEVDPNLTPERWEQLWGVVRAAGRYTAERTIPTPGGPPRWIEANVYPLRLGAREFCVSVMRDVTSRREAEAALRLAGVGTLAAGAAHEINNPLTSVMGNLAFLRDALGEAAEAGPAARAETARESREAVAEAYLAAERVRDVVRGLKAFARPDDEAQASTDLAEVVRGAVALARHEIRHKGRLVEHYGPAPRVLAAGRRLEQVFVNLLVNAAHALPDVGGAGEVSISVAATALGEAVVEVRDDGAGMGPEVRARIFEPFFTTRPVGAGTGLGLSICHGIVAASGGRIEVESEPGRGSTFRVILPPLTAPGLLADPAAGRATPAPQVAPSPALAAGLRILVVDDDRPVLRAVARALGPGPEVVAISDPHEALRRLLAGERFDLVLCDLMMPGLPGMDVHAALREARPAVARRLIFITGGAFTPRAREFLAGVGAPCIDKPFEPEGLRRVVRDRLEALARLETPARREAPQGVPAPPAAR